jgi:hypothetical protein
MGDGMGGCLVFNCDNERVVENLYYPMNLARLKLVIQTDCLLRQQLKSGNLYVTETRLANIRGASAQVQLRHGASSRTVTQRAYHRARQLFRHHYPGIGYRRAGGDCDSLQPVLLNRSQGQLSEPHEGCTLSRTGTYRAHRILFNYFLRLS